MMSRGIEESGSLRSFCTGSSILRLPDSKTLIERAMKTPLLLLLLAGLLLIGCVENEAAAPAEEPAASPSMDDEGWISLFDGETLDGWQASENPSSFTVEDGRNVVHGERAHLFYVGDVENHTFKNFEFKADVMTAPGANSGLYFHTAYQEEGWPAKGYEAQVNNTYESDPRKTGSLYGIDDVMEAPAPDNEWFTEHIIVQGKTIIIKVNDKTLVEYTEPDSVMQEGGRMLDSGTFALQAHDPDSRVYYRNIMVKPLPE